MKKRRGVGICEEVGCGLGDESAERGKEREREREIRRGEERIRVGRCVRQLV